MPITILQPLTPPDIHGHAKGMPGMFVEAALLCVYSCLIIAIPELLSVNRASPYLLSIPVGLLLLLGAVACPQLCFHPIARGALWLVGGLEGGGSDAERMGMSLSLDQALEQAEGMMGPMLGGILAGLVCMKYFPDDPASWMRP